MVVDDGIGWNVKCKQLLLRMKLKQFPVKLAKETFMSKLKTYKTKNTIFVSESHIVETSFVYACSVFFPKYTIVFFLNNTNIIVIIV